MAEKTAWKFWSTESGRVCRCPNHVTWQSRPSLFEFSCHGNWNSIINSQSAVGLFAAGDTDHNDDNDDVFQFCLCGMFSRSQLSMIRLLVQDRNTSNTAVQYTRNTKKEEKTRETQRPRKREVPKQTFVNMPVGLIKCNINFFKKLLTVFLITRHFIQHLKNRVTRKIQLLKNLNTDCIVHMNMYKI